MTKLSPSALSKFKACPRCFWLERTQSLPTPRGIFPTLPGGMDRILKTWYDQHRGTPNLPPEIMQVPGKLFADQLLLEQWRSWRTGLQAKISSTVVVSGALDDLLYDASTNLYHVLDYKTRGSAPNPGATEEYYSTQGDSYALMLQANKLPPGPAAYFVYYWPERALEEGSRDTPLNLQSFEFKSQVVKIPAQPERAKKLALQAAQCLEGKLPDPSPTCQLCPYVQDRVVLERSLGVGEKPKVKARSLAG